MEEIIKEAANFFNINLRGYSKSKASFIIDSEDGPMILKKHTEVKEIELAYKITEALYNAGFRNSERYIHSGEALYISLPYGIYTLIEYGGGNCNFDDIDSVCAVAGTIAEFHKASFAIDADNLPTSKSVFHSYYSKRLAEVKHIKKWLDKQSRFTDIDVLFVKMYDAYLKKAEAATERIYEYIGNTELCLCVGEFKENNIAVSNNKSVTLLNLENCFLSAPETDICRLIRRFVKRGGDSERINDVISAYRHNRELSERSIEFIKAYITFPHNFFAVINKHYNSKRACGNMQALTKLRAEVACQEKILTALNTI